MMVHALDTLSITWHLPETRATHLTAESSVLLRHAGMELPFIADVLRGAVRSLQCLLGAAFLTLLSIIQSNAAVPCLRAARRRSPSGGLPNLTPVTVAVLHLAAAVRRAQVWLGCGGRRSLCLATLIAGVKLLLVLSVLIVTRQPVNGVVRIRGRHPRLQALTSNDHH